MSEIPRRWLWTLLAVFVLIAAVWGSQLSGLSSSNDGSHTALARAMWMRGQATIEPDVALTLGVDRARKDGRWYSDRPPGTAFVAGPVVAAGAGFDAWAYEASVRERALIAPPGTEPYILTYASRAPRAPALAKRIGTGTAAAVAAFLLGMAALVFSAGAAWRSRQADPVHRDRSAQALVLGVAALGLGSLFGPYATMLFAHVTAALGVAGLLFCLARPESPDGPGGAGDGAPSRVRLVAAGAFGSLSVSADYSSAVLVAGLVLALRWGHWRELMWIAAGALPLAILTASYHWVAFGGPFTIGYDYQTNFEFARDRSRTFAGNPLSGLWHLLGWGRSGGGLVVLCPIWILGVWGLARRPRGWALVSACGVYTLLLATHQTPWGGAGEDHRYLVACYPVLMVGLCGLLTSVPSERARIVWGLAGLGLMASLRAWTHTAGWRETPPVVSWWLAGAAASLAALVCGAVAWRRLLADRRSC